MVLELRTTRAEVVGDPDKLQTVIANLISNAIKYSPAGGEIRCRLSVEDGHALVDVVDHGIGITPDQRKQLFKKFGRVDRPETAAIGGTGLGLYLSQELTRRHGGEITVRSRPGKETVFTLRLPLRKPDAVG
jgi:signal transduction histidine kinase